MAIRKQLLCLMGLLALMLGSGPALAQSSPVRVSWVSPTSAADGSFFLDELRHGLRELGHVEGRSLSLEPHWGENAAARLEKIAADVVASAPQVIVAQGGAAIVVRKSTTAIPVVFGYSGDPVEAGTACTCRPARSTVASTRKGRAFARSRMHCGATWHWPA